MLLFGGWGGMVTGTVGIMLVGICVNAGLGIAGVFPGKILI